MKIIGITGPTGAGKTTALNALSELGACIIDSDAVYHELLIKSKPLIEDIDAAFPGVIADGKLERKKLGAIVFENEAALLKLNEITTRHIKAEIAEILKTAEKENRVAAAIDAIRLIESGLGEICDVKVAIISSPEVRAKRIMNREGISYEYALLRINSQKPDTFYIDNCEYALKNDYPKAEDFEAVCIKFFKEVLGGENNE